MEKELPVGQLGSLLPGLGNTKENRNSGTTIMAKEMTEAEDREKATTKKAATGMTEARVNRLQYREAHLQGIA